MRNFIKYTIYMKKYLILTFFAFWTNLCLFTQEIKRCGTTIKESELIKKNINYKNYRKAFREQISTYTQRKKSDAKSLYTIPVVIHVVYRNNTQNISDLQIQSQIDILNADFRLNNADTNLIPTPFKNLAADCQIEFCLAQTDPQGNPTSGITRTQTSVNQIGNTNYWYKSNQGGKDIWDRDQYLNIWVCDLGGGLLGFAHYPGSPSNHDGVVIDYKYFGNTGTATSPYNLGRTLTHELGHWLGLAHIWGDSYCGNDNISDTPVHEGANYGCQSFPKMNSCPGAGVDGEMFMNYMDYGEDACLNMFTYGQKNAMQYVLNNQRASLFNQSHCQVSQMYNNSAITELISPKEIVCENNIDLNFRLQNQGIDSLKSLSISYWINQSSPNTYQWSGNLAQGEDSIIIIQNIAVNSGSNTIHVASSLPNGLPDEQTNNDSLSFSFVVEENTVHQLPLEQSFESTNFIELPWTISNSDNYYGWEQSNYSIHLGYSAYIDNYNYNAKGQVDDLISPKFDLSSFYWPRLSFSYAYSLFDYQSIDTLSIFISNDCRNTLIPIYQNYGSNLSTTNGFSNSDFYPNSNEWESDTLTLSNFTDFTQAQLIFRNTNGYGNNLYIDQIKVDGALNVHERQAYNLQINVLDNEIRITHPVEKIEYIEVINLLGQTVFFKEPKNNSITIENSNYSRGIYTIKAKTQNWHYSEIIKL